MKKARINDFDYLINESLDILDAMGNEKYSDAHYNDICTGKVYKYDELTISLNYADRKNQYDTLNIFIDDICVLNYTFNQESLNIIEGKWIDIINCISDLIPEYLEKKRQDEENAIRKQKNMASLLSYVNEFLEYYKPKSESSKYLNIKLLMNGIRVKRNTHYSTLINNSTCEEERIPFYTYSLLVNDHEVLEFKASSHLKMEDFITYQDKYVPGEWINKFMDSIDDTYNYMEELKRQRIDYISEDIIRKIRR